LHQVSPVAEGAWTRAIMVVKNSALFAASAGRFWLLRKAARAVCVFGPSVPSIGAAS
jgi:hypothetical protein